MIDSSIYYCFSVSCIDSEVFKSILKMSNNYIIKYKRPRKKNAYIQEHIDFIHIKTLYNKYTKDIDICIEGLQLYVHHHGSLHAPGSHGNSVFPPVSTAVNRHFCVCPRVCVTGVRADPQTAQT